MQISHYTRETATLAYVSQNIVSTTKILVSFLKIIFLVIKSTMLLTFTCHFSCNIKNVNGVYDIDDMTTALFWLVKLTMLTNPVLQHSPSALQIFCCISVCVFVCSFTYRSLMCSSVLLAADWLEPDITVLINCINAFWSSCERIRQIHEFSLTYNWIEQ